MNSMTILNTLIIISIIAAGFIIAIVDDILTSIIVSSILGVLIALEFMLLKAPEAALVEGVVAAVLIPALFIMTLKKVKDKSSLEQDEKKGDR